ncbi:MAG TPA: hypothetical protein VFH88_05245 [Candidatus Krumholzibacteria bacterium]|nr:hypothetical protein [Candidatus Krumholzibacteria bacterium]
MGFLTNVTLVAVAVMAFSTSPSSRPIPGRMVVPIRAAAVAVHAENENNGRYYTVQYALPVGLAKEELEHAYLELYVDVETKDRGGAFDDTPVLQVYPLKRPSTGAVEAKDLEKSVRAGRPVAVGEGRHVIVDITRIVEAQITGRIANSGIVVGSVTGLRDGDFRIVPGRFDGNALAQLRIYMEAQ